nr:myb/SANT-like domain-containing protein [Tanacetum cinerariifolium]
GETGLGWDASAQKLNCSDEWWKRNIKEDPNFKKLHKKQPSLELQDAWDQLYEDVVAGGEDCVSFAMNPHTLKEYPSDHPKDKSSLDASAKLTRAKLNKRSRDADLSKYKSGPESPPEFQRSWCVEGHVRSGVISSVLAQRYLRTIRQRHSPGAAGNWFDDMDPKSVDSFEELSQKFLEEFSHQTRYAKDLIEIHGIKRRQNEGLQAFMDRFKSKSSHIKEVPLVLRISSFMHGHGHTELAKKLNDKIPKTRNGNPERNGVKVINMIRQDGNRKRSFDERRSGPTSDPMSLERTWGRENAEEAFTISHELPDQYVTMGTMLTTNCKQLLVNVLRETRRYSHGPDQKEPLCDNRGLASKLQSLLVHQTMIILVYYTNCPSKSEKLLFLPCPTHTFDSSASVKQGV